MDFKNKKDTQGENLNGKYYEENFLNDSNDLFSSNNKPPKGPGVKTFVSFVIALVVVCGIVIGIAFQDSGNTISNGKLNSQDKNSTKVNINDTPDSKSGTKKSGERLSSVDVAQKCSDSVIAVVTYKNGRLTGEGSGVVLGLDESKTSTYIITCSHIVDTPSSAVKIQTKDGEQYNATIVGYDGRTDIAVLKTKLTGLKSAEFGDSSKLKVGETVYAIGNPGGTEFYGSFTSGVVSAIDRITPAGESGYSISCVQHDAAINPGNSGGALVNEYGQVVGINSSKISDTQYEGMGFAVPMSVAKDIVDKIIQNGYVPNRPKLGIKYAPNSYDVNYAEVVRKNLLPKDTIVIAKIEKDSSLINTEAKEGDLIYAVDGKELNNPDVIINYLAKCKVGDEIELSMCHTNKDYSVKKFKVKVKLKEDKGN